MNINKAKTPNCKPYHFLKYILLEMGKDSWILPSEFSVCSVQIKKYASKNYTN